MLKYRIRKELIDRVSAVTSKYRENPPPADGLASEIEWLKQQAATTKSFTDHVIQTLNEILKEEQVKLTEEEEKALSKYLKPTFVELIQKHFS